jgi:sodium-dependent dicarboxylate transporter 2/3/5
MTRRDTWLLLGLVAALVAGVGAIQVGLSAAAAWTAGVTALCAIWWVTEPVPVPVTSLVPFVVFPFTGVLTHTQAAEAYGHHLILLLLGGFILSAGMERSDAHRRIAVGMVRLVGGGGKRLVLGVMLACAVCSMWISNTATTLMLLPVVLAMMAGSNDPQLKTPLLLGLAYSASIGGMGTPVGTPPNVVFMGVYQETTGGPGISFVEWMGIGMPVVAVLLPLAWLWLTRNVTADSAAPVLPRPGPMTARERRVLILFACTAAAWVFRTQPFGGWSALIGFTTAKDSTIALASAVLLFIVPSGDPGSEDDRLLSWDDARRLPWGLLLLFGGGIAIAKAFGTSGLAERLGLLLAHDLGLATWPMLLTSLVIALAVTFLTEVTSNTATTTLLMPVLAAAGIAAGIDPVVWMVPAALSASCAFMLPVATAPNAVVYGTEAVDVRTMSREGFVLNLIGAVVIAGLTPMLVG